MKIVRFLLLVFSFVCLGKGNILADNAIPGTGVGVTCQYHEASASTIFELPITFSEMKVGTHISDQYAGLGIIFGGDDPYIDEDGSTPTSPVLSGSPQFQGDIVAFFVSQDNPSKHVTVDQFSFDAGCFNSISSTIVEWYDINGNKLGEQYNSKLGIEHFLIEEYGIASWRISISNHDPQGFVIDNVNFSYSAVLLTKEDDVDDGGCVTPIDGEGNDNDIMYTICWKNTTGETLTNVEVVDRLPIGVDYPAGLDSLEIIDGELVTIPGDPAYSIEEHTYTWEIGTVDSVVNDPNNPDDGWSCVNLEVEVNENAVPGMTLRNEVEIIGAYCVEMPDPNDPNSTLTRCFEKVLAVAVEETPVCCWDNSSVIYVSENAVGANTGLNWTDAYNTEYGLQMALERASGSACGGPFTIYVAEGIYLPGTIESAFFDVPDDAEIYGGFPTKGCDFANRNPKKYESILSGNIGEYDSSFTVVEMGLGSTIDGVTVSDGYDYNIHGYEFTVNNCIVSNCLHYGIYAEDGNVTITSCLIKNNGADGIYHESLGSELNVSNSWIMRNEKHGIDVIYSTPYIKNSIISESDLAEEGRAGISIDNPLYSPVLHNLTVANNKSLAVAFVDSGNNSGDPNDVSLDYPDIQNCIIYYNNNNSKQQTSGFDPNTYIAYSCVQECVEINNNIKAIPEFAYEVNAAGEPNPENYHISAASICVDKGNPNLIYNDQTDYDNENRLEGLYVDLGADEVHSCSGDYTEEDTFNSFDYNADGIINLQEFKPLAYGWLSIDSNDPGWDNNPNYADPNSMVQWNKKGNFDNTGTSQYMIDMADLELFCENWLWQACWYDSANNVEETEAMAAATQSVTLLTTESSLSAKTTGVASLARTTSTLMLAEDTVVEDDRFYDSLSNADLAQVVQDFRYLQENVLEMLDECPVDSEDEQNLLDLLVFFDDELAKIKESLQ